VLLDAKLAAPDSVQEFARLAPWPVDGLLVWDETIHDIDSLIGRDSHGLPVVRIGSESELGDSCVTFDFYAGMRLIMEHVFERGYRKPAIIVPTDIECEATDGRLLAFHDYCAEHGLARSVIRLPAKPPHPVGALHAGLKLAAMVPSTRPDVAVCYNDQTAIGVYGGVRRAGLRVPQDIAITGFDGTNDGQCMDLPLTTAVTPVDVACGAAIEMLIHLIENKADGTPNRLSLPIRLLTGATT
jgi:LacI family transcriptional regulator